MVNTPPEQTVRRARWLSVPRGVEQGMGPGHSRCARAGDIARCCVGRQGRCPGGQTVGHPGSGIPGSGNGRSASARGRVRSPAGAHVAGWAREGEEQEEGAREGCSVRGAMEE